MRDTSERMNDVSGYSEMEISAVLKHTKKWVDLKKEHAKRGKSQKYIVT